jgi:hypothetical protein
MANLKCPKCQQATASIYKRKDLSAAFAPEALGVVIPGDRASGDRYGSQGVDWRNDKGRGGLAARS